MEKLENKQLKQLSEEELKEVTGGILGGAIACFVDVTACPAGQQPNFLKHCECE